MRGSSLFKWIDRLAGVPLLWILRALRFKPQQALPLPLGGRLLAVKFSAMGDCLLLLPILKAARQQIGPAGRLEIVVTPVTAMVVEGLDWIDAVHLLQPKQLLTQPWKFLGLCLRLRSQGFDWALDFDQWLRSSALLASLSGAKACAGFKTPGQSMHWAFDATAANSKAKHEFEQFLDVAALAGIERANVAPYGGFLSAIGWRGVARQAGPRLAVLHPGCGGHGWQREWPLERFVALSQSLRAMGYRIALSGSGAHERELAAAFEAQAGPADERLLDGGMEALVALLSRATLLVSGNTGVMHLGAGIGTPLIGLHGPTSKVKWGPLGSPSISLEATVPCSPCLNLGFEYGCPSRPCMESIPVEAVAEAAQQLSLKDAA